MFPLIRNACTPGFAALSSLRPFATLRRSVGLLRDFKYEQTDPAIFYGHIAEDTAEMLQRICESNDATLNQALVLDVGGGPGYFATAFDKRGATYFTCEPDVGEMAAAGIRLDSSVRGSGMELPFRNDAFDVTYSSNVAEHVDKPWVMGEEMLRVTKPGGLMVYSYTVWFGPFGGHEMGRTHYLGGDRARRMYERKHGKPPKNYFGTSLFRVDCAEGLRWARQAAEAGDAELLAAFPRYHPWWAWWMVHVPLLREVAVSNLVLVLRRK